MLDVVGQQLVAVKSTAVGVTSAVTEMAKPALVAGFDFVKGQAEAVASSTDGASVGKVAGLAGGAAVAAYLLPAAVCAGATMNAPGAAGFVISRAAFLANPKLYFYLLRTAGLKAAVAAFV
ncbi:hypothetical protein GUJ93_ZPchr0013g37222 [Zizania palustris]|uniref:Uncharacterized protein n=1 Tax=Zizania palustris TaxID=103762 RepID=A0A8J5X3U8_ZIZPA|nr:hypothetical protein GUJ93_ZPchr0013g37222 [Zizania palustris]